MTPKQFAKYIRIKTKTNTYTFPDDEILLLANIIKNDIAKEITKVNEDYFGMEMKRDLVVDKRNYAFPTYILNNIKYLQAMLDGKNWEVLKEVDVNTYKGPTDEGSIQANFAGGRPMFDIFGGQLIIYSGSSIIDVKDGLKLWSIVYPSDLTSLVGETDMSVNPSRTEFGMPTELHFVWATKVIIEYKESKEKPIPLTEKEASIKEDLTLAIDSLKGFNLDRSVVATMPNKGNDGYNY